MAASLPTCFQPIVVVSNNNWKNNSRIKASSSSSSSSSKWWIPLFGWSSSDPDYIIHNPTSDPDPDIIQVNNRSRFAPGCFTEEKAKQLRMKTTETSNFHDIMYHSAIASRLASDLSDRHYK